MIPIVSSWFLMAYFTLMFAVDMQTLWLAIVYFAICLVLGPLLFFAHTFNHQAVRNSCNSFPSYATV